MIIDSTKLVCHSWHNKLNNTIFIEVWYKTLISQIEASQNDIEQFFTNSIENAFYAVYIRKQVDETTFFAPLIILSFPDLTKFYESV